MTYRTYKNFRLTVALLYLMIRATLERRWFKNLWVLISVRWLRP